MAERWRLCRVTRSKKLLSVPESRSLRVDRAMDSTPIVVSARKLTRLAAKGICTVLSLSKCHMANSPVPVRLWAALSRSGTKCGGMWQFQ